MNQPIAMLLWCPECGERHVDHGEFTTKVHHTHACQSCGMVWRPAIEATVGVLFLPGFKDEPATLPVSEPSPPSHMVECTHPAAAAVPSTNGVHSICVNCGAGRSASRWLWPQWRVL